MRPNVPNVPTQGKSNTVLEGTVVPMRRTVLTQGTSTHENSVPEGPANMGSTVSTQGEQMHISPFEPTDLQEIHDRLKGN